jgi:hypothetical protein
MDNAYEADALKLEVESLKAEINRLKQQEVVKEVNDIKEEVHEYDKIKAEEIKAINYQKDVNDQALYLSKINDIKATTKDKSLVAYIDNTLGKDTIKDYKKIFDYAQDKMLNQLRLDNKDNKIVYDALSEFNSLDSATRYLNNVNSLIKVDETAVKERDIWAEIVQPSKNVN